MAAARSALALDAVAAAAAASSLPEVADETAQDELVLRVYSARVLAGDFPRLTATTTFASFTSGRSPSTYQIGARCDVIEASRLMPPVTVPGA